MKTTLAYVCLGLAVVAFAGCRSTHRAHEPVYRAETSSALPFQYYYYPDNQVYLDPVRRVYFWQRGNAWESGVQLPDEIVLDTRSLVTIHLDTAQPYLRHGEVRERYPAVEYRAVAPVRYPFLYYPRQAVYLDPVNHRYFVYQDGQWEAVERPPEALLNQPETPRSVELETPLPERAPDLSPVVER